MRYSIAIFTLCQAFVLAAAYAQPPQTVSYQGLLTTSTGSPVPDGNYSLSFKLYIAPTGGSPLWTELHPSVPVAKGTFSVILGSITALSGIDFNQQLYLEVIKGTDPPLTPRLTLTSAPSSLAPWAINGSSIYYNKGSVGIGTSSPIAKLQVEGSTIVNGQGEWTVTNPGITPRGYGAAYQFDTRISTNTPAIPRLLAVRSQLDNTIPFGLWQSAEFGVNVLGNAAADKIIGSTSIVYHVGNATLPLVIGLEGVIVFYDASPSATMTQARVINSHAVTRSVTPNGTATNVYGLYLEEQTLGANNWSIYSEGTTKSYFGGNVGIGTTTPGAKLEVAGQVKLTGGSPAAGKVLTSDENGLATWQSPAGAVPESLSNQTDVTIVADNDDNASGDIVLRTGTNDRMIVTNEGNVGVGTNSPLEKFEVAGNIKSTGSLITSAASITATGNASTEATNSPTPSVVNRTMVYLDDPASTTITNLTGGVDGQVVVLLTANNNPHILNGGHFRLASDWSPGPDDTITMVHWNGTWYETSRSSN